MFCGVDSVFPKIFLTFRLNAGIFHIILLAPHNIVMKLNNVTGGEAVTHQSKKVGGPH